MKFLAILFGIFICVIDYTLQLCNFNGNTMDCSGMNLTDCPPVNNSIFELILDDNLLKTFSTVNCKNWSKLQKLSAKRNKLTKFESTDTYKMLDKLDLSNNLIEVFNINEKQLTFIDISHNQISTVQPLEGHLLNYFYASNNNIDDNGLEDFIKSILMSPSLTVLDISYNKYSKLTTNFMSLNSNNVLSINFTGNQLSNISVNYFKSDKSRYNLDFSNNKIIDITITEKIDIRKLNLSNNQLSKIDPKHLNNISNLQIIDISHNPLNCLCNESSSFIQWLIDNSPRVANKNQTLCKTPLNTRILDVNCFSSTTKSPITISTTHTAHPITTARVPLDKKLWTIPLAIFILVILIVPFVFYFCYWRKRASYQNMRETWSFSSIFECNCFPLTFLRPRSESDCLINNTDNNDIQYTPSINRLNFDKSLVIICSSKDKKWVTEKIMCNLDIQKKLICSKAKKIEYGDYVMIIVNGDPCLRDHTLINNLEMFLKWKSPQDVRLLIHDMPNFEDFENASHLTDFIKNKVKNKSYFRYDINNPATCISNLKCWLNLECVPQDV